MGNAGRLLVFLPAAAVLLLSQWAPDVWPGQSVLHPCASWLTPCTAHWSCDGDLPNKHCNVLHEQVSDPQPADHRHTKAGKTPRIQNRHILHGYCPNEQLAIPNPYSLYYNVSNGTQFQRCWQLLPKLKL